MKFGEAETRDIELLLVLNPDKVYRVHHKTCKAVIEPTPGEIRIPSVNRLEKGHFKELMDRLTEEVNCNNVRFISIEEPEGPLNDIVKRSQPDDARTLKEAVKGFRVEEIDDYGPPVKTLVGKWEPDVY